MDIPYTIMHPTCLNRIAFTALLLTIAGCRAASAAPTDARAEKLDAQGLALYQQGRFSDAGAAFKQACLLDSREPLFQTHLGLLLIKQTKYGEIVSDFRAITRLAPETPSPHYWLGRGLLLSHQSNYAEPELRAAVGLAPDRWIYHYYLATALSQEEKSAEASLERAKADTLRRAEPRETP